MMEFKSGDIVRYGDGVTALAKLTHPHVRGWFGEQCMGGKGYFIPERNIIKANQHDLSVWEETSGWRTS